MTEARRSYTVVGAGGVGLLYGTRLAAAGHPVRWLVRSGAEEMRTNGIEVTSGGEVLRIEPTAIEVFTDPATVPASDVVAVSTKTTANHRIGELVGGVCAPGATVVLFQNGLGAEELVRDQVPGAGAVLGALCFVCVHRLGPGQAEHLDYGAVTMAALAGDDGVVDPDHLQAAASVAADLRDAGIEVSVLADLVTARWRKLVWNIPFNGLCTVLDASTDALLSDAATRGLVADLMDEVIAASHAIDRPVPPDLRDELLAMTDAMRPYAPSMKLDHDAGRVMEIEAIYDVAITAARAGGAPMHRAEMLAAMLRFLDAAR